MSKKRSEIDDKNKYRNPNWRDDFIDNPLNFIQEEIKEDEYFKTFK